MRLLNWIDERFPLSETIKKHVTEYLAPNNLNLWWAFGAVAIFFLVIQVVTGMWLNMFYKPDIDLAFDSVERIMREVEYGWMIRYLHANGASFIFFAIYAHMGRGIYYGSYKKPRELLWWLGLLIFVVMMLQGFTGYVLPMGQMSYWAGTVITGLAGVIPFLGDTLITFIRGDYVIGDPALNRFFSLHVSILPLGVIGLLIFLHIIALHRVGSNNPEGVDMEKERKITFYPYYVFKDLYIISLVFAVFLFVAFYYPNVLLEAENYIPANPLRTPPEISPEWYFLPFYSILRSIPSKFLGAAAMGTSLMLLFLLPFLDRSPVRSSKYRPVNRIMVFILFTSFIVLGYTGMQSPTGGYLLAGRIATVLYFAFFILLPFISSFEKVRIPKCEESQGPTLKAKRYGALIVIFVVLIFINVMSVRSSWPDQDAVERGRKAFEEIGEGGHRVRYLEHNYYLIKASPVDDEDEEEEIAGPDQSNVYKALGEEKIRHILKNCMAGERSCPDVEMKKAMSKVEKDRHEEVQDDLIAFLRFASDPFEEKRKRVGRWVILFVSVLTLMLYFLFDNFRTERNY